MHDGRAVDDSDGSDPRFVWSGVSAKLRRSVNDEIDGYPTPIPRCDAQFNFLSSARASSGCSARRFRELLAARARPLSSARRNSPSRLR